MARTRQFWEFVLPTGATCPVSAELPERSEEFLKMFKIELGPEHNFYLLCDLPVTMWVHFCKDRTVPCFKSAKIECDFCGEETSRRWMAYYAVYSDRSKQKGLLGLTEGAVKTCSALKGAKKGLLGCHLSAWRLGGHIRGRVKCKLDFERRREIQPDQVYSREDIQAQLFWIMGVRVIRKDGEINDGITDCRTRKENSGLAHGQGRFENPGSHSDLVS